MDNIIDTLCNLNEREFALFKLSIYMLGVALIIFMQGLNIYYSSVERQDNAYIEIVKHQQEIDSRPPSIPIMHFAPSKYDDEN